MGRDLLEAKASLRKQFRLPQFGNPPSRKPPPEAVVTFHMSADQEVIAFELVELTNGVVKIMIRPAILVVKICLARKCDVEERLDVIYVLLVGGPFIPKHS